MKDLNTSNIWKWVLIFTAFVIVFFGLLIFLEWRGFNAVWVGIPTVVAIMGIALFLFFRKYRRFPE